MVKRILLFAIALAILYATTYLPHSYLLLENNAFLSFSLLKIYLFHSVAAIFVYTIVVFVANKIPNQAGYAYLASVFLKIGFFVLIFKASVFTNEQLTKPERFSLIIPLFLFLIAEAIAVSKLLNNK